MSDYVIHFDGSCGPRNPDINAAWGFTITKDGSLVKEMRGDLPKTQNYSNNYAEFWALFEGLTFVLNHLTSSDRLFIRGDSQLVIHAMTGKWNAKPLSLYFPAYIVAETALRNIRKKHIPVSIDWVPREMNAKADKLSKYQR